ncbi:MAG TPA: sortase [Patescibacteria group bacterium]|nr:sortase [Patescibacteria group bacterium]
MLVGGLIAFALGASMLAFTLAPMFLPISSAAPGTTAILPSPGAPGDGSTVIEPSPSTQGSTVAPVPAPDSRAVAEPVDGVSFAMQIPAIGYQAMVRQGVSLYVLAGGPGHYTGTPWPGQLGNVGIAGHNTFWLSFNRLKVGDRVMIRTQHQSLVYEVTNSRVVDPSDRTVLAATGDRRLTMTTCWPLWAGALATHRLVFTAMQIS